MLWHELLATVHSLHAADAVYQKNSDANFCTKKQIPTDHSIDNLGSTKLKLGRPQEMERTKAFLEVAKYLKEK